MKLLTELLEETIRGIDVLDRNEFTIKTTKQHFQLLNKSLEVCIGTPREKGFGNFLREVARSYGNND